MNALERVSTPARCARLTDLAGSITRNTAKHINVSMFVSAAACGGNH